MQCQRLYKQIPSLKLRLSPSSFLCLTCDLEITSLMLEINSLRVYKVLQLWVCMSGAGGGFQWVAILSDLT